MEILKEDVKELSENLYSVLLEDKLVIVGLQELRGIRHWSVISVIYQEVSSDRNLFKSVKLSPEENDEILESVEPLISNQ